MIDINLDQNEQAKFEELFELSKAEAALALSVHFGCIPPEWAVSRFEASLNVREADDTRENAEFDAWVSDEALYEHAALSCQNVTLKKRLEAEQVSATALLADCESSYMLIELRAVFGISAYAVIVNSGFGLTEINRKVLGYVEVGGENTLLTAHGVLGEDFKRKGIKALPAFRQAVLKAVDLCEIGKDPNARGSIAGMMNAHYSSLRRSAALVFAEDYIAEKRTIPVGTFDIEFPYGPNQRVNSTVGGSNGFLKTSLCFSDGT